MAKVQIFLRQEKTVTYKGTPIRLSVDFFFFLAETLQARREWHDIFKALKGKNLQPRIFYPAKLSFQIDGIPNIVTLYRTILVQQQKDFVQ